MGTGALRVRVCRDCQDERVGEMSDIHSCSYYCTRPACVLRQRDDLRDKLEQQAKPADAGSVMDYAVAAGDAVLMNEQAALLRECRFALDCLLEKKPILAALVCGSTTLGNLRASLHDYRPKGVFGLGGQADYMEY